MYSKNVVRINEYEPIIFYCIKNVQRDIVVQFPNEWLLVVGDKLCRKVDLKGPELVYDFAPLLVKLLYSFMV